MKLVENDPASSSLARWRIAEWILCAVWVTAAISTMYPSIGKALRVYGTVFTSYAADLTNPAWLYIVLRRRPHLNRLVRLTGRTPELAAISIFTAGVVTELSQIVWPNGFFAGRYDPLDLVAFATGLAVCYVADKRESVLRSRTAATPASI
jgi:hypothetical protein